VYTILPKPKVRLMGKQIDSYLVYANFNFCFFNLVAFSSLYYTKVAFYN